MPTRILLGPQSPTPNVRQAADAIGADGPAVVITAGWRDSEGEIDDLREQLGRPLEDLKIYQRAEAIFAAEPVLRELKRERQDKLRKLQELYRLRLRPTLQAARRLMRAEADPNLLLVEQRAAIAQVRALDRHHLRRIQSIHKDFNQRLDEEAAGMAFVTDTASVERNYYVNASGRLQLNTPFETADLYAMQKAPNRDDLEFT